MCSEGFDAPRLRVIAYLTTVVTKSRFLQSITRTVRISNTRAGLEAIPREPSYVFAPADPLLIGFAQSWSISDPYLIKGSELQESVNAYVVNGSPIALPYEAVKDGAGAMIKLRCAELPSFL